MMKFFLFIFLVIPSHISRGSANAFSYDSFSSLSLNRIDRNLKFKDISRKCKRGQLCQRDPFRGGGTVHSGKTSLHFSPMDDGAMVPIIFDNGPLWQSIGIFSVFNILGFIISLVTKSHIHLDILGTGAFSIASIVPFVSLKSSAVLQSGIINRITLSTVAVSVWGAKLAGFLFYRALQNKRDNRLEELFKTFSGTAIFWSFSYVWGVICSLPHSLGTTSSSSGNNVALFTGTILYILGLVTETLADYQKWQFKRQNPGKFCNIGLWSISQHPNYFGNILLWTGIFVMNAPSLIDSSILFDSDFLPLVLLNRLWSARRIFLALLSPLFAWSLFQRQASGDMLNSAEMKNLKYGNDAEFPLYKQTVPLMFPKLFPWLKELVFWK